MITKYFVLHYRKAIANKTYRSYLVGVRIHTAYSFKPYGDSYSFDAISTLILQLASVKYDSIYIPSSAVLNNLGILALFPQIIMSLHR